MFLPNFSEGQLQGTVDLSSPSLLCCLVPLESLGWRLVHHVPLRHQWPCPSVVLPSTGHVNKQVNSKWLLALMLLQSVNDSVGAVPTEFSYVKKSKPLCTGWPHQIVHVRLKDFSLPRNLCGALESSTFAFISTHKALVGEQLFAGWEIWVPEKSRRLVQWLSKENTVLCVSNSCPCIFCLP